MRRWLPLLLLASLPVAQAAPVHRYEVRVAEALERIMVRACFDGEAPAALVAGDGARRFLERAALADGSLVPLPSQDRISLPALAPDACIEYRVQLQAVRGGAQIGGPETRWIGRDLLTSIGDWLWRPPPEAGDVELRFVLPPGVEVSTPWPVVPGANGKTYRLGATPPDWPGVVALGRFPVRRIEAGGANLHLAILDGPPPEQQARIESWVRQAARNVSSLHGRFPVESLQVVVAPTSQGSGPVPWAYVARGGGPAVHLFINPSHPDATFRRDWSATHEMSHLFLPYVAGGDAWLAEGMPTYLQFVLMARGGAIDEREALSRMIVGFQRAEKTGRGLTLAQASSRAGIGGVYLRVYWGGAAMMLEADLKLREASGGSLSLDVALARLADCCHSAARRWTAAELMDALDQATGTTVFQETARRWLDDTAFPDFQSLLVGAGVTVKNGEVQLDDSAPRAVFRQAILRPRP